MRILILGAGGFIGSRLARKLAEDNLLVKEELAHLTLADTAFPDHSLLGARVSYEQGDLSDRDFMRKLLEEKHDLIFHLAAVVSGQAEKDFELGMKVNFEASLQLLDLCRAMDIRPRIVFSSSCGVFGGDVSKRVGEDTAPQPRSSYGTQKAMVELLMSDYSRRGFVDARCLRLPTIMVRPGKPNAATSSFLSSIIREPLNGKRASYPVTPDAKFWVLSPGMVIQNLLHGARLDEGLLQGGRVLNLPGLTVSVQEIIDALEEVTSAEVTRLISYEPDAFLQRIVLTWPPYFDTPTADRLGFVRDATIEDIIRAYIEEERIVINHINRR